MNGEELYQALHRMTPQQRIDLPVVTEEDPEPNNDDVHDLVYRDVTDIEIKDVSALTNLDARSAYEDVEQVLVISI